MKKLPVGRQNFKAIIKEDLLYVDKTRQIYELLEAGSLYFLSRPRRFGKSLTVSTLRYLFSGEQEIFKDLYVGNHTNYDWESYPVVQFNFASFGFEVKQLEVILQRRIVEIADSFAISVQETTTAEMFRSLIEQLSNRGKPVVLLVDEYDKPIVDFFTEIEQAELNKAVLRDFFSPLKDLDSAGHLRFLFITGVSKFSKVSLFSDLNNLTDLTVHPLAKDLVGITPAELLDYFDPQIKAAAKSFGFTRETLLEGVKLWYNGYSFDGEQRLYNPFSLLQFFSQYQFHNFWFATGTPTFLVNTMRDRGVDPQELENKIVSSTFFDKFSLTNLDVPGLLFQTGYLTIKSAEMQGFEKFYYLDYPNLEVKRALFDSLLQSITRKPLSNVNDAMLKMRKGLLEGDVKAFIEHLEVLLSDISYHLLPRRKKSETDEFAVWEGYFHTIIYLVTTFIGLAVQSEISKHKGRLDLIAETPNFLYLMEFKLDETAGDAIHQIKNRQYAAAYRNSSKTVYLVGINFSKEDRNVKDWRAEVWG